MNKQDQPGERCGSSHPRSRLFPALCLSLLITACDGGIFGTGEGSSDAAIVYPSGGAAADSEADSTSGAAPASAPTETANEVSSSPVESGWTDFSNTEIGSTATDPQVRVVNVSRHPISFITAGSSAPEPVIAPGTASAYVTAPIGESVIEILDSDDAEYNTLYAVDPLNLGASTVTTLVIRNLTLDPQGGSISVIPLSSTTMIDDPSLALVRVVLAVAESEVTSVELSLQPVNDNPGPANSEFANLTESQLSSNYQLITAGDYVLGSGASFTTTVRAVEGKVQTWVIHAPAEVWDVLTVIDSE
ncbi:MAG: hypothetical protein V3U76_18340 [Granulosicoccus sp.]